jgi:hypothetical protein
VIATVSDDVGTLKGTLSNGQTTDDTTPTLAGTAQPGSTVTLYNNGVLIGTTLADGSGNWSFTTPAMGKAVTPLPRPQPTAPGRVLSQPQ